MSDQKERWYADAAEHIGRGIAYLGFFICVGLIAIAIAIKVAG